MTAGTRVIKDQAALDALLAEYFGGVKASWPKESVDFARETVLAVSTGKLPCGRHVQIEDIQQAEAGKLKVRYRAVDRPTTICVTGEFARPVHIVVAGLAPSAVQTLEFVALADSTDVGLTNLDIGISSGVTAAQNRLITDQASFATLLQTHLARSGGISIDPASVDFRTQSVVGVFLGNTPGAPLVIADIKHLSLSSEGVLYVRASAVRTSNASAATPVTQPFHLVRANVAPGAIKEVVFHVELHVGTAELAR